MVIGRKKLFAKPEYAGFVMRAGHDLLGDSEGQGIQRIRPFFNENNWLNYAIFNSSKY